MFPTKHLVIASAGASEIFCQTSAAAVSSSTRRARVGIVVLKQQTNFFVEGCKDVIEADHGGDVLVIVHLSGQHVHQERERERDLLGTHQMLPCRAMMYYAVLWSDA